MAKEIIASGPEINDFNEMREVYEIFFIDDAQGLKGIYQKNPEALFKPITAGRDTIFHIAAYKGRVEVLQALVEMVPPSKKRELLKMKNIHGNTILHEVAASSNTKAAEMLIGELLYSEGPMNRENDIREKEEILADRNKLGETPLFRAAGWGRKETVVYLAGEIERVGNLCNHYKRNDQLSILHIAVIGQHFDSAIWFLNKDQTLATYKDNDGKTCLHLLASMATAFRSTSPPTGLFRDCIYNCIYDCLAGDLPDKDETKQLPSNLQNKDLEQGKPNKGLDQSERSKEQDEAKDDSKDMGCTINWQFQGFRLYFSICRCLAKGLGFKMINRIWKQKKMHESAVKLANILVRTDASWFEPHELEDSDTICLERKGEEEKVKNSATSGTEESLEPETPLFIAVSTGIVEIVKAILDRYPQAVEHINKKGHNILHVTFLHRKTKVFDFLVRKYKAKMLVKGIDSDGSTILHKLVRGIDNDGSTILHHAANTEYYDRGTKPTPPLQLQEELKWFERVKKSLPSHFTLHRNKEDKTADQLFEDKHKEQLKTAQDWVKTTCESCSTVAVLVAGVVFAAAYQPPGSFHKNGRPVLQDKPLYSFFTVMDVAGLASSLTSVVIFLSVLTYSLEFKDFLSRIPRRISIGFTFLFFSVGSTMLTFTATILLLVQMKFKTQSLTYAAALLPICVFAVFQFPLYYSYFVAAVNSILELLGRNLPGNWEALEIKDD
ncbi:hypothetical protein DITRI_Ditri19aG0010300 [Diplodiscus trichospermus]